MSLIAMSTAISGAQAQELRIANIANNVANVNTTGFKKLETSFSDVYYENLKRAGILENAEAAPRPVGLQIGMGTQITGTYRNMKQGELRHTHAPLDVAINGSGYFAVSIPNGTGRAFTRAGTFQRSSTGILTTIEGNPVGEGGGISIDNNIPLQDIQISADGIITSPGVGAAARNELGRLTVYNFPNESGLEAIGNNLLVETPGSGDAVEVTDNTNKFRQYHLEESNVSAVEELTNLISAHRSHDLNIKVMATVDKIMESINNIK